MFEYVYSLELSHRAGERTNMNIELNRKKKKTSEELKNRQGESEESAGDV